LVLKILFTIVNKKNMGKFVIIKNIINNKNGKTLPVVIIDDQNEIMEFETFEEAQRIKDIFQKNSDSGHQYEVKSI
jgi:hypothetical protein